MVSHQVIIQTAFLGDLLLSIPLLKKIKSSYPDDQIILICKKGLGSYFLNQKLVDQVFEVNKNNRSDYQHIVKILNNLNVNNLFCVHRSLRSQLFSWQVKAKVKIGFKSFFSRLIFSKVIFYQPKWPEALRQLWIFSAVDQQLEKELTNRDWSDLNSVNSNGDLNLIPDSFSVESKFFEKLAPSKRIAVFPGSVWATKKWTVAGYIEVCRHFSSQQYEIFLMGGPDEVDLCQSIHAMVPATVVIAGKNSVPESIDFLKSCALVICNDSAPTHMAAHQNIPVVSIFGPTTVDLGFRPWSNQAKIVENTKLNCRPCGKHGHQRCPLVHHHCMTQIHSSEVIKAANVLLKISH